MKKHHFEAAIIGGGPAGSTAAIHLMNYGFQVCVIEKKEFPRETLCGEFLSVEVFSMIKALGMEKSFLSLNPNPVTSVSFINNNGREINSGLEFPAYGIKRSTLDHFLLTKAKVTGAVLYQPAEVISLKKTGNKYIIKIKNLEEQLDITADLIIAAYGKQNILDKYLSRCFTDSFSGINGVKYHFPAAYFIDYPKNQVQVYTSDSIYCGVNAVNDNDITFCFLEDHKRLNNSPAGQLLSLAEKNRGFSKLLNNLPLNLIKENKLYGTGNIFFGKREKTINGVYMIGDAAGVIAPLAGDGIGMAAESASMLAEILNDLRKGKISREESCRLYEEQWENHYKRRMQTSLIVQQVMLSGAARNIAFYLSSLFPGLMRLIIRNTRSPV